MALDAMLIDGGEAFPPDASDASQPDANDPPPSALDDVCATPWAELTAPFPDACAGRIVRNFASPRQTTDDVAIARTSTSEVVIAFDDNDGTESGPLELYRFHEGTPDVVAEGPAIEPVLAGALVGPSVALAADGPTVHLAYWVRADAAHHVAYRTLSGSMLSDAETITQSVGRRGAVALAIDGDRRAVVAWHDDTSGRNSVRRKQNETTWGAPTVVRSDADPELVGDGDVALAPGRGAAIHFAFQWSRSITDSAPNYAVSTSPAAWSPARFIDNATGLGRTSGVGIDLTAIGDEIVVGYLDWVSATAGEVRLARLRGDAEPEITSLIPDVTILDRPGAHPLVIESDAYGRLHLLVGVRDGAETRLQYWRQTRVAGRLEWIHDDVAAVGAAPELVHVDMVLGPDRRPHIVYWNPFVGSVYYATLLP